MTHTLPIGRLGNQIIRNLAVSIIAKKNNLAVNYCSRKKIETLGIFLFSGEYTYTNKQILNDANYFQLLNEPKLDACLEPNQSFFQTRDITRFLYQYLHSAENSHIIMDKNPYKERYNNNNDLYIHIRLTDAANHNPGIDYYEKAISCVQYDNIHISTDQITHPIIMELLKKYPEIKIIHTDEINTIQYATTFKHIILSHGSFSAIIGYLAFYSNIYYPQYNADHMWYGDMFSIDGWKQIPA